MISLLLRGSMALLLSWLATGLVAAAEPPLTLPAALELTEQHHPALRRIASERRAREPLLDQARLAPPLKVDLELENLAGSGDLAGGDGLESTLSLGGTIERGGKAVRRGDQVRAQTQATEIRLAQQRRDVLSQAALRFVDLVFAQARLAQLERAVTVSDETLAATRRRREAGAASGADAARATLAQATAQLEADQAQVDLEGARRALAMAMGDPPRPFGRAYARIRTLPGLPDQNALVARAAQAPAVRLAEAGRLLAESRLRLAASQGSTDLSWRLGLRDQRASGDQAVVLGFGLALGAAGRAQPAVGAARAEFDAAEWAQASAALEAQSLAGASWSQLRRQRLAFQRLGDSLIPQAQAVLAAITEGYRAGRYSLLELTSAQGDLLALQGRQLAVAAAHHKTRIELERLLGRPLISENQQ